MTLNRINIYEDPPHISDIQTIRKILSKHLGYEIWSPIPEEAFTTGRESADTEVHLTAFKSSKGVVFFRMGVHVDSGTLLYVDTCPTP